MEMEMEKEKQKTKKYTVTHTNFLFSTITQKRIGNCDVKIRHIVTTKKKKKICE